MKTYLGKLGELTLKGSNLHEFELALAKNVRFYMDGTGAKVAVRGGRLYITCEDQYAEQAEFCLTHLIGIAGWALTNVCENEVETMKLVVEKIAKEESEKGAKTFKIEARRSFKQFPLNSYEIACEVADYAEKYLKVDVHHPDVVINVEVREQCYIYAASNQGCRGLPVGTSSKGLLLLSGGLDSPVAGYRMLRRGMKIECVYFHSYPYTSEEAQKKVEDLAQKLADFGLVTYLSIVPFTEVQMKIKEKAPEAWSTLMLRVCMMKVANMLAQRVKASAIITGESLGQVASQTIENMTVTEHFAEIPMLRPLVGLDKEEIITTANFIGTYDISILPYEDCCVLFSPRHPVLRGRIEDAEDIYNKLEVEDLIKKSFDEREVKKFEAKKWNA